MKSVTEEKVKKSYYNKLASKAAKKHGSPPPENGDIDGDSHDDINEIHLYFVQKILPNTLPLDDLKRKILDKSTVEERKLQLEIISNVSTLNSLLINKKPKELFHDQSCSDLYRKIIDLQISQSYAAHGWKVVSFAVMIPMTGNITMCASPIFHTKKCNLFFSWVKNQKTHADMNFAPMSDLFSDESVEQQIPLVQKPTQNLKNEIDWSISGNLENFDNSSGSIESKSSSVDSGRTVFRPQIPVMDANDISQIHESFVDTTVQDSYLDISFIDVKKRMNLSKQDKINILDGLPSSVHSTPVRNNALRPKLGMSFKRDLEKRPMKNRPGYITRFLNRWFQAQIGNMSAELQNELNSMN